MAKQPFPRPVRALVARRPPAGGADTCYVAMSRYFGGAGGQFAKPENALKRAVRAFVGGGGGGDARR